MDGHDQPLRRTENRAYERAVASSLPTYRMKKLVALDRPKATKGFRFASSTIQTAPDIALSEQRERPVW